jgi:hypothetical protein
MSKGKKKRGQVKQCSPREYAQAMLGREDLRQIGQLGLWSAFSSAEAVRRFAALSRAERQTFFARFARSMSDDPPLKTSRTTDTDHRLFDLPQDANLEQIHSRYRELALGFHPDRSDGDTALMQEINAAYQRLQEPKQ